LGLAKGEFDMKDSLVGIVKCSEDANLEEVQAALCRLMDWLGGVHALINPGDQVLIKPNLVEAKPYKTGATTNPLLIQAVIQMVKAAGARNVIVGEGSTVGSDTTKIAEELGIIDLCIKEEIQFIDFKRSDYAYVVNSSAKKMRRLRLPKCLIESNVIINLPVMKTHDCLPVSLGLKNMKGVLHENDKKRFHRWDLEQCLVDLNRIVLPELTILDGTVGMEGLGPVYGEPVHLGLLIGSYDTVAADVIAAEVMGFKLEEINYIKMAGEAGLGCKDRENITIAGENPETVRKVFKRVALNSDDYLKKGIRVIESGACSGCKHCLEWLVANMEREKKLHRLQGCVFVLGRPDISNMDLTGAKPIRFGQCAKNAVLQGPFFYGCPPHLMDIADLLNKL
jgi:uncharacterized protein (DUF362 family)